MSEIRWLSGISGNWTNPSDWAGGVVPGAFDDVEINAGGVYTVTISSADAARSLTLDAATGTIAIDSGGTLSVGTTLSLEAGTLDLYSGGLIEGGTLSAGSGVVLANGGTIDGATIEGAINITTSYSGLIVGPHGLQATGSGGTGRATINVTGKSDGSGLRFGNSQTIDNATINLARAGLYATGQSTTLTIGANAKVNQAGASMGIGASRIVNKGTINAAYSGGTFSAGYGTLANFTNYGGIYVSNKEHGLILANSFENTGEMRVSGSGAFLAIGAHALTNAGTILVNGGQLSLDALGATNGTIQNRSGAVISIAAGSEVGIGGDLYNAGAMTGNGVSVYIVTGDIINTGSFSISDSYFYFTDSTLPGAHLSVFGGLDDTLKLDGVLISNKGNTLRVGAGSGMNPIDMADASISGGTIVDGGGGFEWERGELDAVTYVGDLDISSNSSPEIGQHGVTVTGAGGMGPGTVNVTDNRLLLLGPIYMGGGNINVLGSGAGIDLGVALLDNATVNLGDATGIYVGTATLGVNLTIDQQGAVATLSDVGSRYDSIYDKGVINATIAGGEFNIIGPRFEDSGIVDVGHGDTVSMAQVGYFLNLNGNRLTGGEFDVTGAGSTLVLTSFVTIDAAKIVLSGAGSTIEGKNGSSEEVLDVSLTSIASTGTLELLAGRNWSSTNTIANAGTLDIGAVTFAPASLVNSGTIIGVGDGDIATSVSNNGWMIVQAGEALSLVGGSLTNLVGGTLTGGASSVGDGGVLQLANDTSVATLDSLLILSGSGSVQGYDTATGSQVGLKSSLVEIGASGALELLGRDFRALHAVNNMGELQLGGGTFSGGKLTDAAGSILTGYGGVGSVFADSGAVTSAGGALAFSAAGDVFKGALGGQEIDFTGGTDLLASGSRLTAGTVALSGGAVVTVNPPLTFAGTLRETSATLTLAGKTLTLGGASTLGAGAVVNGTGKLAIAAAGSLVGAAGAGKAVVDVAVGDSGMIEAASGTLDLSEALSGAGAMRIDAAATLEVDGAAARPLTTTFAGSGATLALGSAARFASVIAGFASGDVIELIKTAATAATLESGDRLVITNAGQTVATLKLSGAYAGDSFAVKMDHMGNAKITLVGGGGEAPPPPASPPPPDAIPRAGSFSQQMAAWGAGAGLSWSHVGPAALSHAFASVLAHPAIA